MDGKIWATNDWYCSHEKVISILLDSSQGNDTYEFESWHLYRVNLEAWIINHIVTWNISLLFNYDIKVVFRRLHDWRCPLKDVSIVTHILHDIQARFSWFRFGFGNMLLRKMLRVILSLKIWENITDILCAW